MPDQVVHVLLTRFNLPSPGAESVVRNKQGWLVGRVELFRRYCLPSVRAQTSQDFTWLIYFDPDSPDWLKQEVRSSVDAGYFVAVFRASVSPAELAHDIAANTSIGDGDVLLTTNLDNDDGLAVDFVERLQRRDPRSYPSALYLTNGLIRSGDALYVRSDRDNAFCSVADRWRPQVSTCWVDWHNRLGLHMGTEHIAGAPAWLQVVHGSNVSNRVRGRLVAPRSYRALYPVGLEDLPEPGGRTLLVDRFAHSPIRLARELGRSVSKNLVLRILGKTGLDRIKGVLARRP